MGASAPDLVEVDVGVEEGHLRTCSLEEGVILHVGGVQLRRAWAQRVDAEVHARVHSAQATGANALAEPVAHNRVDLGPQWSGENDQRLVREVLLKIRIMVASMCTGR